MKQLSIKLKDLDDKEIGVFDVCSLHWNASGVLSNISVQLAADLSIPFVLSDSGEFVNASSNMFGTLIDEESPE